MVFKCSEIIWKRFKHNLKDFQMNAKIVSSKNFIEEIFLCFHFLEIVMIGNNFYLISKPLNFFFECFLNNLGDMKMNAKPILSDSFIEESFFCFWFLRTWNDWKIISTWFWNDLKWFETDFGIIRTTLRWTLNLFWATAS